MKGFEDFYLKAKALTVLHVAYVQVCEQTTHEWVLSFETSSKNKDILADARTYAQTSFANLLQVDFLR